MNRISNSTEKRPRPNFVGSPNIEDQSFSLYAKTNIWRMLKKPPVKSKKIVPILQPKVLFLLKFKYAWGTYLMSVINNLT